MKVLCYIGSHHYKLIMYSHEVQWFECENCKKRLKGKYKGEDISFDKKIPLSDIEICKHVETEVKFICYQDRYVHEQCKKCKEDIYLGL